MTSYSITRKALIKITVKAIRRRAKHLDPQTIGELMNVAFTADKIALNSWYINDENCGCLVGTLLKRRGDISQAPNFRSPLSDVGIDFENLLREKLGLPTMDDNSDVIVLEAAVEVVG